MLILQETCLSENSLHQVVLKADSHAAPMPSTVAFAIIMGHAGSLKPPIPRVQSRTTFSFHFGKPDNESSAKETRPNTSTKTLALPDSSQPGLQTARMKGLEVQPAAPGTECCPEHFNRRGSRCSGQPGGGGGGMQWPRCLEAPLGSRKCQSLLLES